MNADELRQEHPGGWVLRHRWKLALALTAVASGFLWSRSRRRARISVEPVSERWLAEHAFTAGHQPLE